MRLVDVPWLRDLTAAEAAAFVMSQTPGIRLTLTQGTPVTSADVTGATSIFAEPVNGGVVPLFRDAAGKTPRIMLLQPSTLSLALGTLVSAVIPNDVFAFDAGAGSIGLEKLAWTSATARATAVDFVNGREYKHGDYTRLLVATFYPTATTTTEDSLLNRYLWNAFNQTRRAMLRTEATVSWNYTTNTTRQANGSTSNQLNYVTGDAALVVDAWVRAAASNTTAASLCAGVGLDSTTTFAGHGSPMTQSASGFIAQLTGHYVGAPGLGKHSLMWNEIPQATGTATFYGTTTIVGIPIASGISATMLM